MSDASTGAVSDTSCNCTGGGRTDTRAAGADRHPNEGTGYVTDKPGPPGRPALETGSAISTAREYALSRVAVHGCLAASPTPTMGTRGSARVTRRRARQRARRRVGRRDAALCLSSAPTSDTLTASSQADAEASEAALTRRRRENRIRWARQFLWLDRHLRALMLYGTPSLWTRYGAGGPATATPSGDTMGHSVWDMDALATATPSPWPWGPDPSAWSHSTPVGSAATGTTAHRTARPRTGQPDSARHAYCASTRRPESARDANCNVTARDAYSSDDEYAYVPARAHASAAAPAPTAAPALSAAVYWTVTTPNDGSYCKKGDAPPAPVTVTAPDSRFWVAVPPGDGAVGWESSGGMDTVDAASDAASESDWSDDGYYC